MLHCVNRAPRRESANRCEPYPLSLPTRRRVRRLARSAHDRPEPFPHEEKPHVRPARLRRVRRPTRLRAPSSSRLSPEKRIPPCNVATSLRFAGLGHLGPGPSRRRHARLRPISARPLAHLRGDHARRGAQRPRARRAVWLPTPLTVDTPYQKSLGARSTPRERTGKRRPIPPGGWRGVGRVGAGAKPVLTLVRPFRDARRGGGSRAARKVSRPTARSSRATSRPPSCSDRRHREVDRDGHHERGRRAT